MKTEPCECTATDHPLAPLTLYKVGGPARLALLPQTVDEACAAYEWMLEQGEPWLVLGGGSNVLIADEGFPGIVLVTTGLRQLLPLDGHRYWIEAGVELDTVVRELMLPENYDGAGALAGIPGSVGGAIYMNAGTVNGSTCGFMESAEIMGREGRRTIPMEPALYGYRGQRFCPPGGLILGGTFQFERSAEDQQAIYGHYIARRQRTQPQGNCCGSVFKNPPGGHAAQLIEACGLKGARRGGAVISEKHANFIMNEANASSKDILALIALCKDRVWEEFGIELTEEVSIIT